MIENRKIDTAGKIKKIIMDLIPYWIPTDDDWTSDSIESLNINSYQYIQIIVNIEEAFDIVMDDEILSHEYFETINDLYNYVLKKANHE